MIRFNHLNLSITPLTLEFNIIKILELIRNNKMTKKPPGPIKINL